MKWILSTALVVTVSVAISAQSGKSDAKPMADMHEQMTYTGCIEVVNHGGSFILTHFEHQDAMKHDTAMKDDPAMKHDTAMKHDMATMKTDGNTASNEMPQDHMQEDHMMAAILALRGRDLNKYIGQRVTIVGSRTAGVSGTMRDDLDTLTVGSLKVVAKSCM